MPYIVPTFNLLYNHWRVGGYDPVAGTWDFDTAVPRGLNQRGALRVGQRPVVEMPYLFATADVSVGILLLVPAGTDIRDNYCDQGQLDVIDCPANSGRWYAIFAVDDVAKGYLNEYRIGCLVKFGSNTPWMLNAGDWPAPIP